MMKPQKKSGEAPESNPCVLLERDNGECRKLLAPKSKICLRALSLLDILASRMDLDGFGLKPRSVQNLPDSSELSPIAEATLKLWAPNVLETFLTRPATFLQEDHYPRWGLWASVRFSCADLFDGTLGSILQEALSCFVASRLAHPLTGQPALANMLLNRGVSSLITALELRAAALTDGSPNPAAANREAKAPQTSPNAAASPEWREGASNRLSIHPVPPLAVHVFRSNSFEKSAGDKPD